MPHDDSRKVPTLVEPLDLSAAGAAFCCRFGEPAAEAYRLAVLREVLSASRVLARTLDEFVKAAGAHYRGVHCTSDMRAEMQRISRALMEWSEVMVEAGDAHRDWQERHASSGQMSDVRIVRSPSPLAALSMTPNVVEAPLPPVA